MLSDSVMIFQWAKLFTQLMRSRMTDLLWRIEWIGGVGYNTSVPSEPQIDVCLAQLPKGEKNPLSARARSSRVEKRTVKIGVGLLPYVWIGSVWQKRRPRHRTVLPGSNLSEAAIGVAIRSCPGVQPRRSYSRPHVIIADSASFANSADRFANNFASDMWAVESGSILGISAFRKRGCCEPPL